MNFTSIFSFLILYVFLSGVSFAKDESEERAKARQAVLAEIEKRQTRLESIKEKREEKQRQRTITEAEVRLLDQEKEALRFTFDQAEKLKKEEGFLEGSKPVAIGVILKFNEWPPSKETAIVSQLEANGLKEDEKLVRLRKWIYKWPQSRSVSVAEELCKLLSSFQSVEYCEADVSLSVDQTGNSRDDLYEEQLKKAREKVKLAEKDVESAKKDVELAEKEYKEVQDLHKQDAQAVQNAEREVQSDKQGVDRAKQFLERAKQRNQGVQEAEERLKDREKMLADSEKWLAKMKEYMKRSAQELEDSKRWLAESREWLKESEKILKERQDWLRELESRTPPDCQNGKVWDGSACVCPTGQSWDGSSCVVPPQQCTGGRTWDGSACVCPTGQNWDGSSCVVPPQQCTGGRTWDGSACVCPTGQNWDGSACVCPTGQNWDGSSCVAPPPSSCPGGKTWSRYYGDCICPDSQPKWDGSKCVISDCSPEQKWDRTLQRCLNSCDYDQKWDGSKCIHAGCPFGQKWDKDKKTCVDLCSKGKKWFNFWKMCIVDCPNGKSWNRVEKQCVCPKGRPKWDGSKCFHEKCSGGRYYSDIFKNIKNHPIFKAKCICLGSKPKWDGSKCVADPCTGGGKWNEFSSKCLCPKDKPEWDGSKCFMPDCPTGQVWSKWKKQCVCELGAKECALCSKGTHWDGNKCVACKDGMEWNESVFVCACPSGYTWNGKKCIEPKEGVNNLRTCGVLSSNFNLEGRKAGGRGILPDYWAQKMTGADLLKTEIGSAPPIKKQPFVQLFDSNRQNRHDESVKNIISSKGKHSVLPELGDGIRTFETNYLSDYSKHTERLLNDVDKVCSEPSNAGGHVKSSVEVSDKGNR